VISFAELDDVTVPSKESLVSGIAVVNVSYKPESREDDVTEIVGNVLDTWSSPESVIEGSTL